MSIKTPKIGCQLTPNMYLYTLQPQHTHTTHPLIKKMALKNYKSKLYLHILMIWEQLNSNSLLIYHTIFIADMIFVRHWGSVTAHSMLRVIPALKKW